MLAALLVNVLMEVTIIDSDKYAVVTEHGWGFFILNKTKGLLSFYMIFNFAGSIIFYIKNYKPVTMGVLSLIFGYIIEMAFMKPNWITDIFSFNFSFGFLVTMIITVTYWYLAWAVPVYIINRFSLRKVNHY